MLGKRFRLVGPLGAGGMGEVYRAEDLELGQTVALKFLPQRLTGDASAMARLRNEVRIARQVSHANVCRVFDIEQADGAMFLCMEYVDGEDLASVLRRMGRPTTEKALQIARQLCAGMAAAHENGVLHRDLKPANVMIDGRGRVRITDFGLAGFSAELGAQDARAGTPAYMAPEQLEGREVSVRSDIYSMGLVLYEVFTGKRAFEAEDWAELRRQRESGTPAAPSSVVADLDPAVERVIQRCLETDPTLRPPSALAVSAALPGGDPLAAALAAGETPSPELLAASGDAGAMSPRWAAVLLFSVLAGLVVIAKLNDQVAIYRLSPFEKPPVVLADRAAEIVKRLGYESPAVDSGYGLQVNGQQLSHLMRSDKGPARWNSLKSIQPTPIELWYRQSPIPMFPWGAGENLSASDPPMTTSGMTRVWLDTRGRLLAFQAVPPQVVDSRPPTEQVDWSVAFKEAGFELSQFTEVEPEWTPITFAERRAAWKGTYPNQPDLPVRVEAASFGGRIVYFLLVFPYTQPGRMPQVNKPDLLVVFGQWLSMIIVVVAMGGAAYFARRNLRMGRGDRRGAWMVSALTFTCGISAWLFGGHHAFGVQQLNLFIRAAGLNLFVSVWLWLMYVALEPYARRQWPEMLIAWSRLLAGRFRDALVARAILFGLAAGVFLAVVDQLGFLALAWLGYAPGLPLGMDAVMSAVGLRRSLAAIIGDVDFLFAPITGLFIIVLVQMVVRRRMLALVLTFLLVAVIPNLIRVVPNTTGAERIIVVLQTITPFVIGAILIVRLGLVALMALILANDRINAVAITLDSTAWYSGVSWLVMILIAALGAWAFHASLGPKGMRGEMSTPNSW